MVKISIKKEEKTIKLKPKAKSKAKPKPKPKQQTQSQKEQTQSQSIVFNVGRSVAPRRRASIQTLQKKAVNNQTPTPNIIVPQAMPQNSNNEILRYIRESEQQKEIVKKQEKSNELEKDKLIVKKRNPSLYQRKTHKVNFHLSMVKVYHLSIVKVYHL